MDLNNLVTEQKLLNLAREIAMDILPLETILEANKIDLEQYDIIKDRPLFQKYLSEQVLAWGSALNTQDRVKIKAAASIEGLLEEFHARMHDRNESLMAKVKAAELVAKLAGMAQPASVQGGSGEKFSVTINMGAASTPITIEATPTYSGNELEYDGDDE